MYNAETALAEALSNDQIIANRDDEIIPLYQLEYKAAAKNVDDWLGSGPATRRFFRALSYARLSEISDELETVLKKKTAEHESELQRQRQIEEIKLEAIAMIKARAADLGLDAEAMVQLLNPEPKRAKKKTNPKPKRVYKEKYRVDLFGKQWYWTGAGGRSGVPEPFRVYFAQGYTKEHCLLPESEWLDDRFADINYPAKTEKRKEYYTIPEQYRAEAEKILAEAA